MQVKEELSWILDQKNVNEKDRKKNIDFVHSLGKKCDSVGWSDLDMSDPEAPEILDAIKAFCKKNGWISRGIYQRTYTDYSSDWYELKFRCYNDNSWADTIKVTGNNGEELSLAAIKAYYETDSAPKKWNDLCVPERFRNAIIKNNIGGVDFCWVQDKGKYDAEQYFFIYPEKYIARVACNKGISKNNFLRIGALGGSLPKIVSVFDELTYITIQDCYLLEDMPENGIVYVYYPRSYSYGGRDKILIHKSIAEILLKEKAISKKDISPACVVEKCPKGYILDKNCVKPKPVKEYIEKSLIDYENIKKANRPKRKISGTDALKLLRKAKSQRKDEFGKKIKAETSAEYELLLPYYQVADGGILSDEYEFLSYERSIKSTEEFFEYLKKEELLKNKPDGKIFALCADGDYIILKKDGKVIRFSHEAPEITNSWQSVHEFMVSAIEE